MDYWGGKYVSVGKVCGKLGGSGGMLPHEILILDLLLDAICWNLGQFTIYYVIKAFIIGLHVK